MHSRVCVSPKEQGYLTVDRSTLERWRQGFSGSVFAHFCSFLYLFFLIFHGCLDDFFFKNDLAIVKRRKRSPKRWPTFVVVSGIDGGWSGGVLVLASFYFFFHFLACFSFLFSFFFEQNILQDTLCDTRCQNPRNATVICTCEISLYYQLGQWPGRSTSQE